MYYEQIVTLCDKSHILLWNFNYMLLLDCFLLFLATVMVTENHTTHCSNKLRVQKGGRFITRLAGFSSA